MFEFLGRYVDKSLRWLLVFAILGTGLVIGVAVVSVDYVAFLWRERRK